MPDAAHRTPADPSEAGTVIGRLLDVAPYAAGYIAAGVILLVVGCLIAAAGTIDEAPDYEGRHADDIDTP